MSINQHQNCYDNCVPVSYTHLDVYKRQQIHSVRHYCLFLAYPLVVRRVSPRGTRTPGWEPLHYTTVSNWRCCHTISLLCSKIVNSLWNLNYSQIPLMILSHGHCTVKIYLEKESKTCVRLLTKIIRFNLQACQKYSFITLKLKVKLWNLNVLYSFLMPETQYR